MSHTPSNLRTFPSSTGLGPKFTSSNSPYVRTPRSPRKTRCLYDSGLSLRRIIGTTVHSPTGFDSLSSQRTFAYTAGAAAVVVTLDKDLKYQQRFFRARPTTTPLAVSNGITSYTPSSPPNIVDESRNRATTPMRDGGFPSSFAPTTPVAQPDWPDTSGPKTWTSRERIKAATCLSISRDGRFLAVGETGYMPRVLIFSIQESSDRPIAIINEHTFGVRAIAFSRDGRYLASLGNVNDGFLYIWAINSKTGAARLHSSNKCTSFIKGMVWMGQSLITVGTRHVKVWRIEDPLNSPSKQKFQQEGPYLQPQPQLIAQVKALAGRNCLLGFLADTTFTCVASISDQLAIVCSDKGDVCILDDSDGQKLMKVAHAEFAVTCVAVDSEAKLVRLGGPVNSSRTITFDDLVPPVIPSIACSTCEDECCITPETVITTAMAIIDDILVTVNSQHLIAMLSKDELLPHKVSTPLAAHRDSVLGVGLLNRSDEADFFTWSSSGSIMFWDLEGRAKRALQVHLEQLPTSDDEPKNQCQVVRTTTDAELFVAGDRYGVLSVLAGSDGSCSFGVKAHTSEILDIAICEVSGTILLASCSRDRTVQLFRGRHQLGVSTLDDQDVNLQVGATRESQDSEESGHETSTCRTMNNPSNIDGEFPNNNWQLLQTMDEHTASVCSVIFCDGGEKLISCSTDRTIHIRQILTKNSNGQDMIAALPIRVITLKASPASMTLGPGGDSNSLVVSMLDRTVATYEISTGRPVSTFRATDYDGTDAVVLNALVVGRPASLIGRPAILAGVSGTDKSVRIYDAETGAFLDREWGHTASVTDVALLETDELNRTALISTGSDGTIMIWDLSSRGTESVELSNPVSVDIEQCPPKDSTSSRSPLRRVLSKAELASFQRPSPATSSERVSPPRQLRKKTSKYSMSTQSPKLTIPPMPAVPVGYATENSTTSRTDPPQNRSRSPASPRRVARQPSLANIDVRGRTKSVSTAGEFGNLNMSTDQVCRTLRAYRKKLSITDGVREESLKELDQELRLTAKAIGEKTLRNRTISETVLAGLLDDYSARLVSMFDKKLQTSLHQEEKLGTESSGK